MRFRRIEAIYWARCHRGPCPRMISCPSSSTCGLPEADQVALAGTVEEEDGQLGLPLDPRLREHRLQVGAHGRGLNPHRRGIFVDGPAFGEKQREARLRMGQV